MPTLSDIFNLDPNVERLTLLPRLRGSLPSEKSVMMPDRYMFDVIAPKFLYDFIRAVKAPGRAAKGEALDEEEALNTAMNMFGGGLATSGSVPLGALGMSARTAPAGSIPLREVPRSPLGFYSKVEEATLPLQNKGSGGQFLAQIQKTPGVKPEEIEVLGLDKFLQSKPTVTKQEIQDYITANKPDVQEVQLGSQVPAGWRIEQNPQTGAFAAIDPQNRVVGIGESRDMALANAGYSAPQVSSTKFSQYTLPGGENYREILLTLPSKEVAPVRESFNVFNAEGNLVSQGLWPPSERIQASLAANPGYRLERSSIEVKRPNDFVSSHFEEPNILTHLRANDRVIDGKKALFIEEIQSDWHQAGRKKGYQRKKDLTPEEIDLKFIRSEVPPGADPSVYPGYYEAFDKSTGQFLGRHSGTLNREQAMRDAVMSANQFQTGVPDAPFKKSWHELALKRAIQEAVDKGYDKLAFTTGKTQAERYDLSKQVNKIDVEAVEEVPNLYFVDVDVVGRGKMNLEVENGVVRQGEFEGKPLEDVVGKEIAEKVFAVQQGQTTRLQGDDLRIGGEGMKGFYDEILSKALQNLTKKYGTKITKSKLDEGSEVWSMDITPQMREQVKAKGQPLFATAPPLGLATQDPLEQFLGYQEAQNDPLMQFLGYK